MNSDFQSVARRVVNDSIRHAVYVDDDIVTPFERDRFHLKPFCKSLYDSFRKKNCTLDFYKFEGKRKLKENLPLFFKRNDLLILDWELVRSRPTQEDTLYLIEEAVHTDSLHFACIFTSTPKEKFEEIVYEVYGYFSSMTKKQSLAFQEVMTNLEQDGFEVTKILKSLGSQFKALALPKDADEKDTAFGEIDTQLKKTLGNDFEKIVDLINSFFAQDFKAAYEKIGFEISGLTATSKRPTPHVKAFKTECFLRINHTLILLLPKPGDKDIKNHDLFEKFTDALNRCSGNFLTIMGLELRNAFLEQSGFVGKDLDSIEEEALFYHFDKSTPKDDFYSFLKELWKSTVFEGVEQKTYEVFSTLDTYQVKDPSKRKTPSIDSLATLNFYYNRLVPAKPQNSKLAFGDVFKIQAQKNGKEEYLLCITPHCDCLYPELNIQNEFHFVKGEKASNLKDRIKRGDGEWDSYFQDGGKTMCIQWKKKPFTIFIDTAHNSISKLIPVKIGKANLKLKYFASIKENYAQRIANDSFRHASRVGIFFVNAKELK